MEKSKKNNITLIGKISLMILFWPFTLIYYIFKNYKNNKEEKEIKKWTDEIKRRYNNFPLKDSFTDEEIIKMIIQDLENEIKYQKMYKIQKDREFVRKMAIFMGR